MSSSKAQGLSLNTIIIAAIVLVVLLILVGMTTGYFGKWGLKFGKISDTSCKGQGGEEKPSCDEISEKEIFAESAQGQKCCAKKACTEIQGAYCGVACVPGESSVSAVCDSGKVCCKG